MSSLSTGPIEIRVAGSSAASTPVGRFCDLFRAGPSPGSRAAAPWIPPAFVTLPQADPSTGPVPLRSHLGLRDHLSWLQCGVELLVAVVVVILEPQIVPILVVASIISIMSLM